MSPRWGLLGPMLASLGVLPLSPFQQRVVRLATALDGTGIRGKDLQAVAEATPGDGVLTLGERAVEQHRRRALSVPGYEAEARTRLRRRKMALRAWHLGSWAEFVARRRSFTLPGYLATVGLLGRFATSAQIAAEALDPMRHLQGLLAEHEHDAALADISRWSDMRDTLNAAAGKHIRDNTVIVGIDESGPHTPMETLTADEFTRRYGIRDDIVREPPRPEQRSKSHVLLEQLLAKNPVASYPSLHPAGRCTCGAGGSGSCGWCVMDRRRAARESRQWRRRNRIDSTPAAQACVIASERKDKKRRARAAVKRRRGWA